VLNFDVETRYRLRLADFHALPLEDSNRFELIDGMVIAKPMQNPPHAESCTRLRELLDREPRDRFRVREEKPLALDDYNEKVPDLSLVPREIRGRHPTADEAFLVVEVADSSFHGDRIVKLALYDRTKLVEYWILNVPERELEVYRRLQGRLILNRRLRAGDEVRLVAFPDVAIVVGSIFEG
jgi:Uma2 family endonuclease